MPTLYGIANCDTVQKARNWLEAHGIACNFHDYRKAGIDAALLQQWLDEFGHERLLNRRGTTWRQLSQDERAVTDARDALRLMLAHPALIKRPVFAAGTVLLLGFDPAHWRAALL